MSEPYYTGDLDTQLEMLVKMHTAARERGQAALIRAGATKLEVDGYQPWNLQRSLRLCQLRVKRHFFGTSKYGPHQGARERARRRAA